MCVFKIYDETHLSDDATATLRLQVLSPKPEIGMNTPCNAGSSLLSRGEKCMQSGTSPGLSEL